MYQRKLEKDIRCPLEYGMELFGGKWNSRIICVLAALGTLRYSELRHEMGNITDAVLASTLKKGSSPTALWNVGHTMKYRRAWSIR